MGVEKTMYTNQSKTFLSDPYSVIQCKNSTKSGNANHLGWLTIFYLKRLFEQDYATLSPPGSLEDPPCFFFTFS